jgi:uncharacterized membrane protein YbhN (UPF0104 family)
LNRTGEVIAGMSLLPLLGALAALTAAIPVNALRWHLIIAAQHRSPRPRALLKLLLVGLFFNQVLPSGIGGDAVRAWRCRRLGIEPSVAIRSVILDRVAGYVVILALYIATLPVLYHILTDDRERHAALWVAAVSVCGLAMFALVDRLPARALRARAMAQIAVLSREGRQLLLGPYCGAMLALSAATVGLTVLGCALVGQSLGLGLSIGSWTVILPAITMLQLIPVSFAGWGVRELGLVVLLGAFGVPAEPALATSIVLGVCLVIVALPGGLIWLTDWDLPASPVTADLA